MSLTIQKSLNGLHISKLNHQKMSELIRILPLLPQPLQTSIEVQNKKLIKRLIFIQIMKTKINSNPWQEQLAKAKIYVGSNGGK